MTIIKRRLIKTLVLAFSLFESARLVLISTHQFLQMTDIGEHINAVPYLFYLESHFKNFISQF